MIEHIAVKGYRLFRDFETDLQPGINVLIGANASGKSTLIELLRIIQSSCLDAIRPGIEPRPLPGEIFHPDGGLAIKWGITVALSQEADRRPLARCHHSLVLGGPAQRPRVAGEALTRLLRKHGGRAGEVSAYPDALEQAELIEPPPPFRLLFWALGQQGWVLEGRSRRPFDKHAPSESLLTRVTDPRLYDCNRFRNTVLRWRFYSDLVISRTAALRSPRPVEGSTALDETGNNLASTLLSLFTNLDYGEQREDLLSFLRSAFPEFRTLTPTPDTASGHVVLQWVEDGLRAKLSGADLSDGVLRFLALAVICCDPYPPPLVCIDEPEIGLHPRLLPLVGGMLRHAAERSQVIVLTHSPELLYGMPLESIAVLRKEGGDARVVWPRHNDLLYSLLTSEVAGERQIDYERLSGAFTSGELDTLE